MEKELRKFFTDLVEAPSPSGFEQPAQDVYRRFVKKYTNDIKTDVHGNVIALRKGKGKLKTMICGHVDEIGFMVNYIDNEGFVYVRPVGGIDANLLPGLRVNIYGAKGIVRGIFGKKAIHLMSDEDLKKGTKLSDLWIDIGAPNKKEAEKRIEVGDIVTFSPGLETLHKDVITTKATDNKVGVFVAGAILHYLAQEDIVTNLYSVSAVQEEIGMRGARTSAFGIDPDVGIAIDVTTSSDHPDTDKKKIGDIAIGKGPVIAVGPNINPKVFDLLKEAAKKEKIKFQIEVESRATGTDANAIQVTRAGVATGLVCIPNRYMHSPNEVISLKDLDDTAKLIAGFIRLINDKTNFIPGGK
ncbi:MAG: M42 family metallopeptidase [Candidatus Cloacimonetes bacterium]|nr:M42 family metallopeptidase [Candidatus Cloacimonadota bacterium]